MNRIVPIFLKLTSTIWYAAILLALAAGWAARDHNYLVAESGIGYWLGIIGGSLMLLLLVYPMRKRFRRWALIGSVKAWFRIHMILGLAGPLLIVFHSGFKLGSFNSSVALFCMLIVTLSGLLGRYLYERIHHGLYGRKLRFEELYSKENLPDRLLRSRSPMAQKINQEFGLIETGLTHRHTGVNRSISFYRKMRSRIDRLRRVLGKSKLPDSDKKQIFRRLKALRSICVLGINEILFSYWHILHLPLFIMLIMSGLIHVAVVHLY
ncbi:MAG: hypothetical protein EP300_01600 [Gammaproteobacteria bacterium]|nr:MAG: hypothetical protein EP300_01600 [Gammaproteobacteria bacterium]